MTTKRTAQRDKRGRYTKPAEVVPVKDPRIEVRSLAPGQLLELDGFTWRVKSADGEEMAIVFVEWAPSGDFRIEKEWHRVIPANTLVTPVQ